MKKIKEKSKNSVLFNVIAISLIVLQIVLVYVPCLWGIAQTFKSRTNWILDKIGFPTDPTFTAYELFFRYFYVDVVRNGIPEKVYFEGTVLNTLLYAGGSSFLGFICQYITAYVLFRYKHFRSSPIFYSIIVIAINLPLAGGVAASLKLYHALGFYDNMVAMWILNAHPHNFYFLVLYSSLYIVPNDLYEAAEVDGAGRFMIMFRIALPLVKAVVFLYFLNTFIAEWNNYQTCLMYMPSYPTVGYGLYKFKFLSSPPEASHSTVKLASAFMCALPVVVLFVIFGNKMMKGVSVSGGIKG